MRGKHNRRRIRGVIYAADCVNVNKVLIRIVKDVRNYFKRLEGQRLKRQMSVKEFPDTPEGHIQEIQWRLQQLARKRKLDVNDKVQFQVIVALATTYGISISSELHEAPAVVEESIKTIKKSIEDTETNLLDRLNSKGKD